MRILWLSDSPTSASGYGNITRFVCEGLARIGHDVSVIGREKRGRPRRRGRYMVYPFGDDESVADLLFGYVRQLQPDVVVTLDDPWRVGYLTEPALTRYLRASHIRSALYYPIDSDGGQRRLSPRVVRLLAAVDLPIVMSRYGQRVTQANGVTPAHLPVGVDGELFRPPADKATAKRAVGYDHKFVILSDARNQIRKLLPRTLEIFRRFADGKDDVLLHLHCDPDDPEARSDDYCYDILSDVALLGLSDKVRFTRGMSIYRGISLERLAALYQAADVHLLASYGEGFGLPTLQAASAGVVPFAAGYAASRELVRGHGEPIRVRHFVRRESGMRCALVDIGDAVDRLDRLYRNRALLRRKSQAARRFAEAYSWQRIVPKWHALLEREVSRARAASTRDTGRVRASDEVPIPGGRFTIPVSAEPTNRTLVQTRVLGRVYLASARDLSVFQRLRRVFPQLSAWSGVELEPSARRRAKPTVRLTVVPGKGRDFLTHLAASTLALDIGGVESVLPALAAEAGVPLVGSARIADQRRFWPDLTLATPDVRAAAEKGRWMLTDHGEVSRVSALARKRRGVPQPPSSGNRHQRTNTVNQGLTVPGTRRCRYCRPNQSR